MTKSGTSRFVHMTHVCAWLALCAAGPAQAQIGPLTSPPTPPTALTPAAGIYPTTAGSVIPFSVGWSQFFPSGGGIVLNPVATHFVVCLDPFVGAVPPAPCTLAIADFTETIATPSAALRRTGNTFAFTPGRNLTTSERNVALRFTVGACSALVQRSCRFTSVDIAYSSINAIAAGTGLKNTGNAAFDAANWTIDVRANNSGTSELPQFDGTVEYWEVLGTGNAGRDCFRNVDDPIVRNDMSLVAFDVGGRQTLVPSLPRMGGVYSGPPIQGIYRLGSAYDWSAFTTTNNPSLPPLVSSSRGVGTVVFPVPITPAGMQPRTFVVASRLDSGGALPEINENDNLRAQCKLR